MRLVSSSSIWFCRRLSISSCSCAFCSRSSPASVNRPMKLLNPSEMPVARDCSGVTTALTMVAGMVANPVVDAA